VTTVTDLDLPVFDTMAADLTGEVYHQRLADVRRHGWLARSPLAVVVLDRDGGEFFLRSKATTFPGREIADIFGVTSGQLREHIEANILNLTGARHRRLRALIGPAFSPRAADRWRPVMREFLAEHRRDGQRLHDWSTWVQRQFDIRALGTDLARIERAAAEVYDYAEALLERRRAEPADDLISSLLAAEAQGDRLSHVECVNLVVNVLAGGIDTTQSQLAHALRLFAGHPEQWALLGRRPELVLQAVSEVLRFEPITPFTARLCTEEVEYRGLVFPAGTIVAVCAERANREPAGLDGAGQDAERFDITVDHADRLLTFGAGPHFCLGSNLARAELEEALTFLAPRMPGLALDGPAALGGVEGIYGIDALPLSWS
jgi:cytochrome P450